MKRIIILVLAFIIFTVGCSSGNVLGNKSGSGDAFVIYNGIKNPDRTMAQEYLAFLENEKGIRIESTPWDGTTPITDLDGILKIDLKTYRQYFDKRQDFFLPLNDILASNMYSMDIPDGIMNAVKDDEGNIWGFLISHDIDYMERVYSDELLTRLGTEVPKDPYELSDFMISAKEEMDLGAIRVCPEFCVQAFYDIFAYFNCHLIDSQYTIGWNILEQKFMDVTYTDEMRESLEFIRQLDNSGLIDAITGTYYLTESAFIDGKTATTVLPKGYTHDSNASHMTSRLGDSVFYMEYGSEQERFYIPFEYDCIYVIPKNTTDAAELVNEFIDTFYGDEQVNKTGQWGIDGVTYNYVDPEFITFPDFDKYFYPKLTGWWLENRYAHIYHSQDPEYMRYWTKTHWPEIKDNYYNGVYQLLPLDKSIDYSDRTNISKPIHLTFNALLYKFIKEDMTVDAFLDEYDTIMKNYGLEEYLRLLNENNDIK